MGGGMHSLASAVAQAKSTERVMSIVMDAGCDIVGADATGIYLLETAGLEIQTRGVNDADIDRYLTYYASYGDPLLEHLQAEHSPVHEQMIYDERSWRASAVYDIAIAPANLCHYMLAPIFRRGAVMGALTFGRATSQPPFDISTLAKASTLASYLSSAVAGQVDHNASQVVGLSERHRSVMRLVARGLTNCEIAQVLSISLSYVKKLLSELFQRFEVTTRAELAALVGQER